VECKATVHRWYIATVVLGVATVFALVVYLWWKYKQDKSKDDAGGDLAMQLTDNPLQAYGQNRSPRGSLSRRAAERRSHAYLAVRVLYQPVRILVGYIQVLGADMFVPTVIISPHPVF
jgi:hypothetical protein